MPNCSSSANSVKHFIGFDALLEAACVCPSTLGSIYAESAVDKNSQQSSQTKPNRSTGVPSLLDRGSMSVFLCDGTLALILAHLASHSDRGVSSLHGQAGMVGQARTTHRSLWVKRPVRIMGRADGLEQSPIQALQEGLVHAPGSRPWQRASQFQSLGTAARRASRRRLDLRFHVSILMC